MTKLDRCLNFLAIMAFVVAISWGFARLEHLGYEQAEQDYQQAAINAGFAEMRENESGQCEFVWKDETIKARNVQQAGKVR